MRLTTVFMIAAIMQVSASGFAQRVTFKAKQGTLQELFKAIKAQTGYNVVMSAEKLEAAKSVSADFKNELLEKVLEESLEGQNLTYTIDQKTIVIREKEPSFLERLAERWASIDAQLDISWSDVIESTIGSETDMATFVVYNPSRGAFAVRASVVARSVESYDILLPSAWSGENVHVYMIFVAVGGKAVSSSAYLGATVVQ